MRRRLEVLIPLVMFAVLGQFLAPIGAINAVAGSSLAFPSSICSAMANVAGNEPELPSTPHAGASGCCVLCFSGIAGPGSPDHPVGMQRPVGVYQKLRWNAARVFQPIRMAGEHAQARAPPASA